MKVHEIFRSIQGEGRLTGTPMTFVRLFGCNREPRCSFCDTPQEDYQELAVSQIVVQVEDNWVCLTGGEPLMQSVGDLVDALHEAGRSVVLETNGTLPIPCWMDWVCVSPKKPSPAGIVLEQANEVKLLVGSGMYDVEEAVEAITAWPSWQSKISLQPVWDDNYEANLQRAIELCQKHQVRLSVQVHKLIGVK